MTDRSLSDYPHIHREAAGFFVLHNRDYHPEKLSFEVLGN